jgi:hypothetical protein
MISGWFDFLNHALPPLRDAGFVIEVDENFPHRLLRGDDAFEIGLRNSSESGWRDHLSRFVEPSLRFFGRDQRQSLNCFAEAHVVGENAAQTDFAQKTQP